MTAGEYPGINLNDQSLKGMVGFCCDTVWAGVAAVDSVLAEKGMNGVSKAFLSKDLLIQSQQ